MLRVFINPGHDLEIDPGTDGNGLVERYVASDVGKALSQILTEIGYPNQVLQSNNLNGEDPSRPNVCATANNGDYDIFVSIHCNGSENPNARGTETLVYELNGGKACILANCIQKQIVDSLGMVDRGVKERADLCVLRETSMPAVLVEIAFLSNADDAIKIRTKLREFARAIARGITDYELEVQ